MFNYPPWSVLNASTFVQAHHLEAAVNIVTLKEFEAKQCVKLLFL